MPCHLDGRERVGKGPAIKEKITLKKGPTVIKLEGPLKIKLFATSLVLVAASENWRV